MWRACELLLHAIELDMRHASNGGVDSKMAKVITLKHVNHLNQLLSNSNLLSGALLEAEADILLHCMPRCFGALLATRALGWSAVVHAASLLCASIVKQAVRFRMYFFAEHGITTH